MVSTPSPGSNSPTPQRAKQFSRIGRSKLCRLWATSTRPCSSAPIVGARAEKLGAGSTIALLIPWMKLLAITSSGFTRLSQRFSMRPCGSIRVIAISTSRACFTPRWVVSRSRTAKPREPCGSRSLSLVGVGAATVDRGASASGAAACRVGGLIAGAERLLMARLRSGVSADSRRRRPLSS